VSRECLKCHQIEGVGAVNQAPVLKNIAAKYDLAKLEQRISDPTKLMPDAEMPPFNDKLTPEQIHMVAQWLIKK